MRAALLTLAVLAAAYLGLRAVPAAPATGSGPFAGASPLVFAHRGGMGLWPENTLHGFRQALALGVDVLEIDLRRSRDGRLVVFHDEHLERTTDGRGALAAHTWEELERLDAGHRFSLDGGRSFPFRGAGLGIPALAEVLTDLPGAQLSLELKEPALEGAQRLCALVEEERAGERVLVASFHQEPLDHFRELCPDVPTAATPGEAWRFYLASRVGLTNLVRPRAAALFLFERLGPWRPVSKGLVSDAADLELPVFVWGAPDEAATRALLEAGVAGITTDHPDRLLATLGRRREP